MSSSPLLTGSRPVKEILHTFCVMFDLTFYFVTHVTLADEPYEISIKNMYYMSAKKKGIYNSVDLSFQASISFCHLMLLRSPSCLNQASFLFFSIHYFYVYVCIYFRPFHLKASSHPWNYLSTLFWSIFCSVYSNSNWAWEILILSNSECDSVSIFEIWVWFIELNNFVIVSPNWLAWPASRNWVFLSKQWNLLGLSLRGVKDLVHKALVCMGDYFLIV